MPDAPIIPALTNHIDRIAAVLVERNITANCITLASVVIALSAMAAIGLNVYWLAFLLILLNRAADGLDGTVARLQAQKTGAPLSPFGSFADIMTDMFLYGGIVFAFILGHGYAMAGAFLLFTWLLSALSSIAYLAAAEMKGISQSERAKPALLFLDGVSSQTEMAAVLLLMCVFPAYFPAIAFLYGIICLLTTGSRVLMAYKNLR